MYLPSRTSHARLSRARVLRPQPRWVKEDDAIRPRIEEAAPSWIASGARATVKDNGGLATRIAAHFPIELVHGIHGQHAVVVRLDMWIHRLATEKGAQGGLQCTAATCRATVVTAASPSSNGSPDTGAVSRTASDETHDQLVAQA